MLQEKNISFIYGEEGIVNTIIKSPKEVEPEELRKIIEGQIFNEKKEILIEFDKTTVRLSEQVLLGIKSLDTKKRTHLIGSLTSAIRDSSSAMIRTTPNQFKNFIEGYPQTEA